MRRMIRVATGAVAIAVVAVLAAILGGSAVWNLSGAHSLDIEGHAAPVAAAPASGQWRHYGADAGGSRYSGAAMITTANVGTLERAWVYSTGDLRSKPQAIRRSAGESTPILVEDSLVFCTPFNEVIALDPETGAEKWRYDPKIDLEQRPANQFVAHFRRD